MSLPPKILLLLPISDPALLKPFVERCLRDSVELIAVVGEGSEAVESAIDWIIVDDGYNGTGSSQFILTSSHPSETIADILAFAEDFGTGV